MDEHLKRVIAHHDWWAETYDSDYFENFALYHKITMDNIKRFLPKDKQGYILDAGGGTGIFSIELAKMGYQVVLTDISEGMLEVAKKKIDERGLIRQIEIVESNVCGMPEFPDDHFDMVLSEGDPLSYCGDYERATAELARVAQPSGCVIASVDSKTSALRWLQEADGPEAIERLVKTGEVMMRQDREDFSYVIHAFTSEELRQLFESNGLSVERIIGKPVIAHRLQVSRSEDPEVQEWLYRLELDHCDAPDWLPWGGHLEIVGRKR
jgi:ubiquinone/menaquinone biosynthesis C-methylase UbiE